MILSRTILTGCLLLGLAAGGIIKARAFYCSKPDPPYCIDAYGTFEDEWSFRSCKSEMENYFSDVDRYTNCLFEEAEREASEARDEASEAVERFNCKARGETFC